MTSPAFINYRQDIDGLRAIAVLLVLGFHAFPDLFPGGFIGVDVFFVISGYLISSIIISDLKGGTFSFRQFYARRVRRIFPAVALVLMVMFILGWFLLLPDEYEQLGKHAAGGAAFLSNFVLLDEAGYFDSDGILKPLLHLWSLGVEEQFYFVWPLLLYVAWRWKGGAFGAIFALLGGSFALNLILVHDHQPATYYLPFTRFWELMVGCALAYGFSLTDEDPQFLLAPANGTSWLSDLAVAAGLSAIFAAAIFVNRDQDFPGWWAVLPTAGAFILIRVGLASRISRALLAHPVLVFFGRISFPLYLWHWPLLSLLAIVLVDPPSPVIRSVALGGSVVLAWLTYRYLEQPIRSRNELRMMPILGTVMASAFLIGEAVYAVGGVPARMKEKAEFSEFFGSWAYTRTHDLITLEHHECNFYDIQKHQIKARIDPSCYTPHAKKAVFLWGDSHAQHLNYGLRHELPDDVSLLQVGSSGCSPAAQDRDPDALGTCNRANRFALEEISLMKPEMVILAQQSEHEKTDFESLAVRLRQAGVKKVILVGPVPEWQPFLFKLILKEYWGAVPLRTKDHLVQSVMNTDAILRSKYEGSAVLTYISLVDGLCNADGCVTHVNEDLKEGLITYDYGHLTLMGSDFVVRNFLGAELAKEFGKQHSVVDGR